MNARELPAIATSTYATTAYNPAAAACGEAQIFGMDARPFHIGADDKVLEQSVQHYLQADPRKQDRRIKDAAAMLRQQPNRAFEEDVGISSFGLINKEQFMAARLVRVIIADPNENIPLQDRLLHAGEEQFTDLTDQELFFEIDIAGILKAHNDKRVKVLDKKASGGGKEVFLEPARVRDLKMVVVNVASFA